ncbi:ABC transporter substrate-binding protein [Marinoscillum furvescens]|uniref:Iron complex transport system substrate-binding protein n=1 Tax=Marinoscillum furvescens DSM 4134 TaxID=1122208 RepID=A0A3D9L4Q7_MARFU|nr:ABC transporter substrate-binding protein [Marinoscillum furvescens]RED99394.1 iron complex transport system substrate-binding protein [Marinoscillum furvescens DSM 4134]
MTTLKNLFTLLLCALLGCTSPSTQQQDADRVSTLQASYATRFDISGEKLTVREPWPGAQSPISYSLGKSPQRVVVTSTTHLPYLELLGLTDRLVGFPGTQYISSPAFRQQVASGAITELGPDGNINLELLISLNPDVVFAFDMGSESTTLDKITESGIPVVYNADYLESSALGRAEWIKFFGAYFDKEKAADSIFNHITNRYDSLQHLASQAAIHPTLLSGVLYGDVWFMPGGQNWAAEFYRDAGGEYLWADDSTSGWLEISFESVFNKARHADYWIGTSTFNTREELLSQDARYGDFAAFQNDRVYNYSKRRSPSGGYDFFESGYARPDRVLADLIAILHPELLPDYETYYFEKLP